MNESIKLPAIKGVIGDWVYYQTTLPFSEIINRIDNNHGIREYKTLDDYLQRELSKRSKKISSYLLREQSRFFNTAIIGLFGSRPKWYTFGYSEAIIKDYKLTHRMAETIGILELSGKEILFSIDGQHRIEGIKQAFKKDKIRFELDELPIIIIGHNDTIEGKKRTRRLFSEINTKAIRVSGLDDLITNEDNPVFINARKLYAEFTLFNNEEFILLSHKANIDPNDKALTTILNLKEVNKILYQPYYKHEEFRPEDRLISDLYKISTSFWKEAINSIDLYKNVIIKKNKKVNDFRYKTEKKAGGSLLFRPIGIKLLAEAYTEIKFNKGDLNSFWRKINSNNFDLNGNIWNNIAWDDIRKNMIPKREKLLQQYLYYLLGLDYDSSYLEIEYNKAFDISQNEKKNRKKLPKIFQ